jgi:hypothetical protein
MNTPKRLAGTLVHLILFNKLNVYFGQVTVIAGFFADAPSSD